MGRPEQAKQALSRAIDLCGELSVIRLSAIDTEAQLALLQGRLQECDKHLAACAQLIASHRVPGRSWYDLAHQVTRCTYFERLGDWEQIVTITDDVDPELARRQYKAVRTSILCFKARALARMGRTAEAQTVLAQAVRCCPRSAVDPLIVLEASKAVCFALEGEARAAAGHFDKALAAARAIGHRYHEQWIAQMRTELDQKAARTSISIPHRDMDTTDASFLLTDVATVLGAGHSIDLMAHRISSLLESTTLRTRVTVESDGGCDYQPEPSASWETEPGGSFAIHLRGSDRRVAIRVGEPKTIDELSLLKSLTDIVQAAVSRTIETEHEDDDQNLWPRATVASDEDVIFRSPRMIELLKIATRLAATDLPVLITGETGTGKEIFARLIHENSRHRRGPLVAFNCSTVPRDLVESQLFGHRRGAFTGASESFAGMIRSAEKGTLFLDELGDLELAAQPKLLRFLESGEVQPLGEVRPVQVPVRVVAATNADIEQLVREGRFRSDLFYRVGVAKLALPALRERKDEIPALASLFLTRSARECHRAGLRLADDFVAALLLHDWPGNIRELANEIRRVVAFAADGDVLTAADLAPDIARQWHTRPVRESGTTAAGIHVRLDQTLAEAVSDLEERFIEHALEATGGRVAEAAQLLGLSRKGLFLKRRRRGLVPASEIEPTSLEA